jgi:hypothetical protein
MSTITSQPGNNAQQPSYLIASTTTTITTPAINGGNETSALCDIKILCTQRKKVCDIKNCISFFMEIKYSYDSCDVCRR